MSSSSTAESKRRRQVLQQAQQYALNGEWETAVTFNREILEAEPNDVAALNRLGKALSELGQFGEAYDAYHRSVDLDPTNQIARRNLQRLEPLRGQNAASAERRRSQARPALFIEEIGKTRVTELQSLAENEVLAQMTSGDQVELRVEGKQIVVYSEEGLRLGQLEAPLAQRLIGLITGGNRYTAAVTVVEPGMLRAIIRESYQHPSQAGRLSFPIDSKPLAPRAYTRATERLYADEGDFLVDDDDTEDEETPESEEEEFSETEEPLAEESEDESQV